MACGLPSLIELAGISHSRARAQRSKEFSDALEVIDFRMFWRTRPLRRIPRTREACPARAVVVDAVLSKLRKKAAAA